MIIAAEPSVLDRIGDLASLWAAIAAGTFGVIGAVVGHRLGHRSWERDRRLDAYSRALGGAHATWRTLSALRDSPDESTWNQRRGEWSVAINDLAYAVSGVELLGPDDVGEAALAMQDSLEELAGAVNDLGALPFAERESLPLVTLPAGAAAQAALEEYARLAKRPIQ